jgi:hypothetical protein
MDISIQKRFVNGHFKLNLTLTTSGNPPGTVENSISAP